MRSPHTIRSRALFYEQLESRCLLATEATLWFHDNNLGISGGKPLDWEETFTQPEQWDHTLRSLDSYVVNDWMLLRLDQPQEAVSNAFLADELVPTLNKYQVNLVIDSGAATFLGYNRQVLNATTEQILQPYGDLIQRLRTYGAQLERVSLQGVLSKPLIVNGQEAAYSMNQRMDDAVQYATYMTSRFPDLKIGTLDTLPTWGLEYVQPYRDLQTDLAAVGVTLDHIGLEMNTELADQQINGMSWDKAVDVQYFVQQELGIDFGVTMTSIKGLTSAELYHQNTVSGFDSYQTAIAQSNYPNEQPDFYQVISWYAQPDVSLPEAPQSLLDPIIYSTTHTALAIADRIDSNYERNQIPVVGIETRTAGDAWNLVNGSGLLDRENLPLPRWQWLSEPNVDANEWVKASFCRQSVVDALHVWNFNTKNPGPDAAGVSVMDVYTSVSGIGNPVDNPNQWTRNGQYAVNRATGVIGAADPGQLIDLVNTPAVAVALVLRQNYGGAQFGLGELRFLADSDTHISGNDSPWLNDTPDITIPENTTIHELTLSGITAGCDEQQPLRVSARSDNPNLIPNPQVDYSSPNNTALLRLLPTPNSIGTAIITVSVEDGGLDGNLQTIGDNATVQRSFKVVVAPDSIDSTFDFGDAPDTYRTWRQNGGPVHRTEGPILGTQRTADADGKPSPNADADEGDDGVVFAGLTIGSQEASIQVQVTGEIINGGAVSAWIDFNGDGSFGGAYEQIVKPTWVTNGVTATLSFPIPADARPGYTYARVRVSSSGGLPPSYPLPLNFDLAPDGEVEDYRVQLSSPAAGGMQFVKHIAGSAGDGMRSVVPVDLDQDGDIDFLTASVHNDNLAWLENLGDASFVTHQIAYVQFLRLAYPVDIDADGDLDVVTTVTGEGDRVILFENNGSESFTQRIIAINFDGADTISAADVNADGQLDFLVGSYADDRFRIIENQGSGTFVASELGIAGTPRSIIPADMDRDGNLDIIVASHRDNTVAFYRGDRFGSFDHIVIDDQFVNPQIAVPVDFDLDGDVDIVAGQVNGSEIRWYEQTQAGVFTKRVAVSQQLWPRDLVVADLDGDGDMDMVVVEEAQGDAEDAVVAYVNDGTMQFARRVVGGGFANAHAVWVADVDGDGDLDVAVASRDDEDVVWFEQTGFGFDFGDAPDTYRTWPQNGGPAHRAEGPMLGVLRTADTDGQPSPNADADEGDDGVTFGLLQIDSEGSQILVDVSNAPAGAFIDAWIDFNRNGTFDDPGEQIAARFPVSNDTTNAIQIAIPATAQAGVTYARVRISSIGGLPPSSDSPVPISQRPDGEVEDYQVTIEPNENGPVQPNIHWQSFPVIDGDDGATIARILADCCDADGRYLLSVDDSRFRFSRAFLQLRPGQSLDRQIEPSVTVRITLTDKQDAVRSFTVSYSFNVRPAVDGNGTPRNYYDFGDAPFVYKTTAYPDSPRHVVGDLRLGTLIDPEPDGQNHYQALGDDIDSDGNDDDGVRFVSDLIASHSPTIATVIVESSGDAMLDAWIDFNRNGKFDHPQEHLSQNQLGTSIQLRSGESTISFVVPDWAIAGYTYARFRLSSQGGLMPTGIAADGEIEDYALTIVGDNVVPGSGIFREHVVSTSAIGARAVVATDVDRDGDVDLLSVSDLNHDISWYENDGQENFTRHAIGGAHFAIAMHPVDMEGDGDLDIVAASFGGNDSGVLGNVFWFENDGQQNFTRRVVGASVAGPHSVFTADMDADGDLDVLVAASDENTVSLYLNDGDQQFTRQMIDSNSRRARGVHATDLDGDGDLDILAASQDDNTVAWYENDSQGNFTKFIIDDEATGTQNAFPADVDGDGDLDVIAGWREGQAIAWYENQGDPQFVRHFVDSQSSAKYAMAIDMDGDGDVDVLAADAENGSVLIYENDGTGIFTRQLVADNTPKVQWAVAYDIDRDGDLDVASASWADNKIAWYENNALPTLSAPMSVEVGEDSPAFTIDVSDVTPGGRENQQVRFTVISDFRLKPFTFTGVEYDAVSGIGRLSVTPLPNAFGTSDVILQLEDAGLDNDFSTTEDNAVIRQVITISVTPVNDQPVAQALEAETDEDTSIRVLLPVMDIEGLETASVSITNASVVPLGAVGFEIISGSIWLTYDPSQVASIQAMGRLDSMTETIAYEVNDGDGGKTEAVITILVRGKNDWYHHSMPLDVNGNMTIEPLDVLVIINRLNSDGSGALAGLIGDPDAWYDVNDDGSVSPIDALIIINHLNGGTAEGERIASGLSPSGYYREIPAAVPKSQTVPRSDARSSVDPRQELAIGYPAFTTSTPGFEYDDTDDNWKEIDELIDLFVRDTAPKGDWWQE